MRLVPAFFPMVLRALPLTAAFFALAADGPCTIIVDDGDDDDDDDEDCADLGDICPSLSCENGNVLDGDGCAICECNATACDVDAAGPPPECANAFFDEQLCSWSCQVVESCFSDSDCGRGFRCELTDCANAPDADCGGGFCVQVTQGCSSDADCGAGFVCDFSGGGAVPPGGGGAEEPCFDDNGDGICDGADDRADPAPPPPEGQCIAVEQICFSDADCGDGFVCEFLEAGAGGLVISAGTCVFVPPVACSTDEECGEGQHCEFVANAGGIVALPAGICVDNPPVTCFSDGDCQSGEFCNFDVSNGGGAERPCFDENNDGLCDDADIAPPDQIGTCQPLPAPTCNFDGDCAEGEFCSFGDADRVAPPCDPSTDVNCDFVPPPEGVCKPIVVDTGCNVDDDCGNGQVCAPSDCVCDASCQDDGNGGCLPCVCPGTCVDVACFSDADCKSDEFCAQSGADIAPPPECDPASGEACRPAPPSGVCRDLESDPCAAVCGEGVACAVSADGSVACAEPAQTCTADSECADGQLCSTDNCVPDDTGACLGTCSAPRPAP